MAKPQAINDTATTGENTATLIDVLGNDPKGSTIVEINGSTNLLRPIGLPGGTSYVQLINGQIQYSPGTKFDYLAAGQTASETFTYTVRLNNGKLSTATVTVTINGVNDAPVGESETYSVEQGDALAVSASQGLLANDMDPDSTSLTAVLVSGPAHGTLQLNSDGSFNYVAEEGFIGQDTFTYAPSDGGLQGDPVTVTVNVLEPVLDLIAVGALLNNDGTSTYDVVPYNFARVANVYEIAALDYNNDGLDDVLILQADRITLLGNEGGTLSTVANVSEEYGGNSIAVADLNGDGLEDFVLTGGDDIDGHFVFEVWASDGTGFFKIDDEASPIVGNQRYSDVALADFNGDGDLDAVVSTFQAAGTFAYFENLGGGDFELVTNIGPAGADQGLDVGDVNGDGFVDVAVVSRDGAAHQVWLGDGSGGFTAGAVIGLGNATDVKLGDLDDDGDLDAVVLNIGVAADVYLNDGTGSFTKIDEIGTTGPGLYNLEAVLGDVDNDGDLDAVLAPGEIWLNDGTGQFDLDEVVMAGSTDFFAITASYDVFA